MHVATEFRNSRTQHREGPEVLLVSTLLATDLQPVGVVGRGKISLCGGLVIGPRAFCFSAKKSSILHWLCAQCGLKVEAR